MAAASVAKALELYGLALRADSAGQLYRPMLLRAIVDGLQFGAPIQGIPVRVGTATLAFSVIAQDAVVTSAGAPPSAAAMLLAWRGANAEQILVVLAPYGTDADSTTFDAIGFYLHGDDTPRIARSGAADFRLEAPGVTCVYEQATPLVGPPGQCAEERLTVALDLTLYANGDSAGTPEVIHLARANLNGVRITRNADDFSAQATLQRARPR